MWLLPQWCSTLHINLWDGETTAEGSTVHAETEVLFPYRTISLSFYASWLNEPPDHKEMVVIHELIHASQNIMFQYALDVFDEAVKDKKLRRQYRQRLASRCEGATQDLAVALYRRWGSQVEE